MLGPYADQEPRDKPALVAVLLPQVFGWARSANPIQPITSGLWNHESWGKGATLTSVESSQLLDSDVISFHDYGWPEKLRSKIAQLSQYGRPLICTEYMARGAGSTIDGSAPVGKAANVGMLSWGLVVGKTQTNLPWDSWQRPYTLEQPIVWHHDLFYPSGNPYRAAEAETLRRLSALPKRVVDLRK